MPLKTKRQALTGAGVLAVIAIAGFSAALGEVKLTLDQLPPAVRDTILREAGGAAITEIEQDTENGQIVYDAEFVVDGQEVEIEVAPDGTLLSREVEDDADDDDDDGADDDDADDDDDVEREITADQVPAAAMAALTRLSGGAALSELEVEIDDGVAVYEAAWLVGGVEHEAAVTADGTLVGIEETIADAIAPASVRAAIGRHIPAGTPVTVEKKTIVLYEVEAKFNGREKEILVLPTGKVLRHDDDDDDKDDDDGDDHDGEDDEGEEED